MAENDAMLAAPDFSAVTLGGAHPLPTLAYGETVTSCASVGNGRAPPSVTR